MSTRKRRPGRSDDDFDREIRSHLELEAERLIEDGMTPDAARAAAHRRFGSVTAAKERFYEAGRRLWLDRLVQDVRCAIRNLRRYPVAAAVGIASLAAGIGATTVTLTVRNIIFRKPPPTYGHPGQISRIQVGRPDRPIMPIGSPVPAALYTIWHDALGSAIAASTIPRGVRDVRTEDRVDTMPVRAVTAEFFSVLDVRPEVGRIFSSRTPDRSAVAPAVLSYSVWERLFDRRPDVAGRILWIDGQPHTVIGVLPRRFWFSEMNSPIWTELEIDRMAPDDPLQVIVRRPDGVTPDMLDARLQGGLDEYARRLPAAERQLRLKVSGIEGTPLGRQMSAVLPYVLATSVLLTLLIACANVAILMIAQWTAREHEIAIRASIGASRGRIVRLLLTESIVVAVLGGALGICATFALHAWILHRGGADITFFDVAIDPGVLIESAFITLLTGIVAGIAPAMYETRRLHVNPLRTMAGSDRVRQRWRHALVVLEITVTVALLVETATMIDGYQRATTAQLGFATRPLMAARLENPRGVPAREIVDVLAHLPGVAAAAASTSVPYAGIATDEIVAADPGGANAVAAERAAISPGFFTALGVPVRVGRVFLDQDSAARAAIVNESLARRLFPAGGAVGGRIWIARTPYDVIGVVGDYSNRPLPREFDPKVFLPLGGSSRAPTRLTILIRANGDPAALVKSVRDGVRESAPGTAVVSAYTLDQIRRVMGQEILLGTAPLFPLIAIGILLTTAGIYGVLAFAITRRSRELAVRIAVGATGRDLVRLVTGHTIRLVSTGSALGVALTFGLSRVVRAGGGAGSVFDPSAYVFLIPIVVVFAIGAVATWIPSRRALKINPAVLLRTT